MAQYPWNSPYAFAENRVIDGVDLEGLEFAKKTDENGQITGFEYVGYNTDGTPKAGTVPAGAYVKNDMLWVASMSTDKSYWSIRSYSLNDYGMVELPLTTEGSYGNFSSGGEIMYSVYNRSRNDQWGNPYSVAALINSAIEYKMETTEHIAYGDLSNRQGATFGDHLSHVNGTQIDWLYPNRGDYDENDLQKVQTFINILYRNGQNTFILAPALAGKIRSPETNDIIPNKQGWMTFGDVNFLFNNAHNNHGHTGTYYANANALARSPRAKALRDFNIFFFFNLKK